MIMLTTIYVCSYENSIVYDKAIKGHSNEEMTAIFFFFEDMDGMKRFPL